MFIAQSLQFFSQLNELGVFAIVNSNSSAYMSPVIISIPAPLFKRGGHFVARFLHFWCRWRKNRPASLGCPAAGALGLPGAGHGLLSGVLYGFTQKAQGNPASPWGGGEGLKRGACGNSASRHRVILSRYSFRVHFCRYQAEIDRSGDMSPAAFLVRS